MVYIAGAIGREMLGGATKGGVFENSISYAFMPVEEQLEMTGFVILRHGLTSIITAKAPDMSPKRSKATDLTAAFWIENQTGAGDKIRTHDPNLGNAD